MEANVVLRHSDERIINQILDGFHRRNLIEVEDCHTIGARALPVEFRIIFQVLFCISPQVLRSDVHSIARHELVLYLIV